MLFISHRGNVNGREYSRENSITYIEEALAKGYDVEIDVWYNADISVFKLGHYYPTYLVSEDFLLNNRIWCHAKDEETLCRLIYIGSHCFFHDKDDVVLTSRGFLWTYPGKKITNSSICVLPEVIDKYKIYRNCKGVCSDYIKKYKEDFYEQSNSFSDR